MRKQLRKLKKKILLKAQSVLKKINEISNAKSNKIIIILKQY